MTSYDEALARIDEYAAQIAAGEAVKEATALDRAQDLLFVFGDKRWVDELDKYELRPKANVGVTAARAARNTESPAVFTKWVNAHDGMSAVYAKKLLQAATWQQTWSRYPASQAVTFTAIEPMYRLDRRGYGDRTPDVLTRAQELAGDGEHVEPRHTKQALTEFWDGLSRPARRKLSQKEITKSHDGKLRAEINWFIEKRQFGTLQQTLKWAFEKAKAAQQEQTPDGTVTRIGDAS